MMVVREFLIDVKGTLRGWKLILPVIIILVTIIMSLTGQEKDVNEVVISYYIWSSIVLSPKLSKIHYLLPGDEKIRFERLLLRSFMSFIYNILWYWFLITITVLLGDYHYLEAQKHFFTMAIPILVFYTAYSLNNSYNSMKYEDPWLSKHRLGYIFSFFLSLILIFIAISGIATTFSAFGFLMFTLIFYLVTSLVLYWQIKVMKNTDLSYENIRKVDKLF